MEGDDLDLDFLKGEEDFDAEAFLNVKQENLVEADIFSGANASLMEKYIQVLSYEQKQKPGGGGLPPPAGGFNQPPRRAVNPNGVHNIQQSPLPRNSQLLPPISPTPAKNGV